MSRDRPIAEELTATVADAAGGARSTQALVTLGRYRLERKLGEGGMGVVHAALDIDLERRVAIKLLHGDPSNATRARLLREARAMARIDHPNVVTIYEVDSVNGTDFVVMELVDGTTLVDWLRAAPRSTREILDAFLAAGRGLAAAHAAGMVHRDFKPHNVLRSHRGNVMVSDFGLARESGEANADGAKTAATPLLDLTQTGMFVGTPAYMAPEQWANGTISPSVDQFAFCVALWEAVTGARPFQGTTTEELRAHIEAGPAKLDASRVPRRLRSVLVRGLDPDPAKRWPSMDALLATLARRRSYVPYVVTGAVVTAAAIALGLRGRTPPTPPAPPLPPPIPAITAPRVFVPKNHTDLMATIHKVDAGHYRVPRATVKQLLLLRDDFLDGARAVPSMRDDQMLGFKLYAIRPRSLYAALGFKDLDVIRAIDGVPLTTEAAVLEAFDRAHTATEITIDFERGTSALRVAIAIEP